MVGVFLPNVYPFNLTDESLFSYTEMEKILKFLYFSTQNLKKPTLFHHNFTFDRVNYQPILQC